MGGRSAPPSSPLGLRRRSFISMGAGGSIALTTCRPATTREVGCRGWLRPPRPPRGSCRCGLWGGGGACGGGAGVGTLVGGAEDRGREHLSHLGRRAGRLGVLAVRLGREWRWGAIWRAVGWV